MFIKIILYLFIRFFFYKKKIIVIIVIVVPFSNIKSNIFELGWLDGNKINNVLFIEINLGTLVGLGKLMGDTEFFLTLGTSHEKPCRFPA